jgi:thioredoxin 1
MAVYSLIQFLYSIKNIMNKFETLINGGKPVLVDFFEEWCGPCKSMAPILKEVKQKVGESAVVIKVDIDKNEDFSNHYNIHSVPTLILFKAGKILWRKSGIAQQDEIYQQLLLHQ